MFRFKHIPRFRFSLRTLMLVITVLCIWPGVQIYSARRQRLAVEAIRRVNGTVTYDYERVHLPGNPEDYWNYDKNAKPPVPEWLRNLFGDDFFCTVVEASFDKESQSTTPADLAQLANLPNLQRIYLDSMIDHGDGKFSEPVRDNELDFLQELHRLNTVVLSGADIAGSGLVHLANAKHLKNLFLDHTHITDSAMESVARLTDLESLDLSDTSIGDAAMEFVGTLTNLQSLDLTRTRVTDAGLSRLRNANKLESLRLSSLKISNAGFCNINSNALTFLELDGTNVGDGSMERIGKMIDLTWLSLTGTQITDRGMQHIRTLTKLRQLYLANTKITDGGLSNLNAPELLDLYLNFTKIGNSSLKQLGKFKRLRFLYLDGTQITDEGLPELANLPNLSLLGLSDTSVSDAGLVPLFRLPSIDGIQAWNTHVSSSAFAKLLQIHPNAHLSLQAPNRRSSPPK
jgi:internalin A